MLARWPAAIGSATRKFWPKPSSGVARRSRSTARGSRRSHAVGSLACASPSASIDGSARRLDRCAPNGTMSRTNPHAQPAQLGARPRVRVTPGADADGVVDHVGDGAACARARRRRLRRRAAGSSAGRCGGGEARRWPSPWPRSRAAAAPRRGRRSAGASPSRAAPALPTSVTSALSRSPSARGGDSMPNAAR